MKIGFRHRARSEAIKTIWGAVVLALFHNGAIGADISADSLKIAWSVLTRGCAVEGRLPIRTLPIGVPDEVRISFASWSLLASHARTFGAIRCPNSVSTTPRPVRWKRRPPHPCSSSRIWRLICGWLVPYAPATLLRLPSSAASMKSFQAAYSTGSLLHVCRFGYI
jgi:hypothetical protein